MNEPLDPVSKRDLDATTTVVMVHNQDQQRLLVNGLITGAIVLIIAFLLAAIPAPTAGLRRLVICVDLKTSLYHRTYRNYWC